MVFVLSLNYLYIIPRTRMHTHDVARTTYVARMREYRTNHNGAIYIYLFIYIYTYIVVLCSIYIFTYEVLYELKTVPIISYFRLYNFAI